MKLKYVAILLLLSLIVVAGAEDAPPGMMTGEIEVMEHHIIVKQEYGRLAILESMVFINVGDGVFEGKVQARIPGDARVEFATGHYYLYRGEDARIYWPLVLPPNESIRMDLVYTTMPPVSGTVWKNFIFEMELQYPTGMLVLAAVTEKDVVASAAGLAVIAESIYNETLGMNVAIFGEIYMLPQRVEVVMEWTEVSTAAKYVGGIALVVALIALPILKRRGIKKEGHEELGYRKKTLLSKYRKEALLSTLNQIENEHRAGEISEVEYRELKSEYEEKIIQIMKKLDKIREDAAERETKMAESKGLDKAEKLGAKKSIRELKMKKDALISMLKRVEDDYKAGAITKDEYQELKSEYEDKAIKIMRRLDEMR